MAKKQKKEYRVISMPFIVFPERVWEQSLNGQWYTRPATAYDREQRAKLAKELKADYRTGSYA